MDAFRTLAKVHDKDVRNTTFQDEEEFSVSKKIQNPKRIWRTLDENNLVAKVDFTKRFEFLGSDAVLKFGIYGTLKERDFSIAQYSVSSNYTSKSDWDNYGGDPNQLLTPTILLDPSTTRELISTPRLQFVRMPIFSMPNNKTLQPMFQTNLISQKQNPSLV